MARQMQLKRPCALCTHAQTHVHDVLTYIRRVRPTHTWKDTRHTSLRVTRCLGPINLRDILQDGLYIASRAI